MGHLSGGCDICAANLKRVWCYMTCNPEQHTYMEATGYKNVTDPFGQKLLVQEINYLITEETSCDLFKSCEKIPFVQQLGAMQSAHGYLEFQGIAGESIALAQVNFIFNYTKEQGALDLEMGKCEDNITELWGYNIQQQCGCNCCKQKCTLSYTPSSEILKGFDWVVIVVTYTLLTVFIILLFIVRMYRNKKLIEQRQQNQKGGQQYLMEEANQPFVDNDYVQNGKYKGIEQKN